MALIRGNQKQCRASKQRSWEQLQVEGPQPLSALRRQFIGRITRGRIASCATLDDTALEA